MDVLKDLGIRGRVLMLTLLPSTLLAVVLGLLHLDAIVGNAAPARRAWPTDCRAARAAGRPGDEPGLRQTLAAHPDPGAGPGRRSRSDHPRPRARAAGACRAAHADPATTGRSGRADPRQQHGPYAHPDAGAQPSPQPRRRSPRAGRKAHRLAGAGTVTPQHPAARLSQPADQLVPGRRGADHHRAARAAHEPRHQPAAAARQGRGRPAQGRPSGNPPAAVGQP